MSDDIICPSCGTTIQITQALKTTLSSQIKADLNRENEAEKKRFQLLIEEKEQEAKKIKDLLDKQLKLEQDKLESEKKRIEQSLVAKMQDQIALSEAEIRKKLEEENAVKEKDIYNRLKEAEERRRKDQDNLLDLMKQLREKDEKEHVLRMDMEKRLGDEIKKTYALVQKQMAEQYEMQLKERDKLNDDLRRRIEELQMKASESSVQIRGEIAEIELENLLKELFPEDTVSPIGKGKFGADVAQKVRDQYGRVCGVILWESKHTKQWQNEWLPKLREDLRTFKGNVAVLASLTLPDGIGNFGVKDGVWVTNYECLPSLAMALRHELISVAYERNAASGKGEKMEMLYNYLIGHEFRQKIEAIVEVFTTMREDLEKERNVMERVWKKRDMQLARLAVNTSRMYGEMQGLVGSALQTVDGLELDGGEDKKPEQQGLLDLNV